MKRNILICLFPAVFAVFMPLIINNDFPVSEPGVGKAAALSVKVPDAIEEDSSPVPVREAGFLSDIQLSVLDNGQSFNMSLEEYIVGVVAGEMPASFEAEALKAQAVAARTYTLYKMVVSPSPHHRENVCTDPGCCKAYASLEALREKWGDDYEENIAKIKDAVEKTKGEYIVYDALPILAVFHSSSSGSTESSENVWSAPLPYLVSVASPENGDEVNDFVTSVKISHDEFKETFLSRYPDAVFSQTPGEWITSCEYSESGRLLTASVGGITVRGTELRSLFSLRSAAIQCAVSDRDVEFTVSGYGHGVGMSQYGANAMAKAGSNYREILTWYYTGVNFENLTDSQIM